MSHELSNRDTENQIAKSCVGAGCFSVPFLLCFDAWLISLPNTPAELALKIVAPIIYLGILLGSSIYLDHEKKEINQQAQNVAQDHKMNREDREEGINSH